MHDYIVFPILMLYQGRAFHVKCSKYMYTICIQIQLIYNLFIQMHTFDKSFIFTYCINVYIKVFLHTFFTGST